MVGSTWGIPTASKHVLLLHGITGSSQFWYRVAADFASRGYFVTAPDLPGHGLAKRESSYTFSALAEELRPLFGAPRASSEDCGYDVVVGYSLGGVVAAALLPSLKPTRPVRVVLVDPPLELTSEMVAFYKKIFSEVVKNPPTPEAFLEQHPHWMKEEAVIASAGAWLCDLAAVEAIFDQNVPWSFSHFLSTVQENVEVIVLAADPSKEPRVTEEQMKAYPHVTTKTVLGASHLIPVEFPEVVIEASLE